MQTPSCCSQLDGIGAALLQGSGCAVCTAGPCRRQGLDSVKLLTWPLGLAQGMPSPHAHKGQWLTEQTAHMTLRTTTIMLQLLMAHATTSV
jgi:hypothetical protein